MKKCLWQLLKLLAMIFHILRTPLALLLCVYLLLVVLVRATRIIHLALEPLCVLPGLSRSPLCSTGYRETPQWTRLVDIQSSTFDQLLDQSAGGSGLALEVKKAEMATTDLVTLVRISDLSSRDLLAESLMGFVEDAKNTGRDLQRLGAKISGAVDR